MVLLLGDEPAPKVVLRLIRINGSLAAPMCSPLPARSLHVQRAIDINAMPLGPIPGDRVARGELVPVLWTDEQPSRFAARTRYRFDRVLEASDLLGDELHPR